MIVTDIGKFPSSLFYFSFVYHSFDSILIRFCSSLDSFFTARDILVQKFSESHPLMFSGFEKAVREHHFYLWLLSPQGCLHEKGPKCESKSFICLIGETNSPRAGQVVSPLQLRLRERKYTNVVLVHPQPRRSHIRYCGAPHRWP